MFEVGPLELRKAAIDTVGKLSRNVMLNDMSSRIIHPILRLLNLGSEELRGPCINTLNHMLLQLGSEFAVLYQ